MKFTRKLTLEAPGRVPDGAGGFSGGWTVLGTHWGSVRAVSGRLERGEEAARSRAGYRITLRAVPPGSASRPEAGQRFKDGSRVFSIRAVWDDADTRHLICLVDEEVAP